MVFKMKKIIIVCINLLFIVAGYAQNVGINQSNPTNTLHITPITLGDNPLRIDGVQSYSIGDTSLLMINTTTGIVKYINPSDFVSIISNGNGLGTDNQNIDSLVLNGLTLTTFIENGNSASVNLTAVSDSAITYLINHSDTLFTNNSFVDSLISVMVNNSDTLFTNQVFIDSIVSIINNNTDTLFSNQTFIDSLTTLLYNNSDTLLSDTTFINNLRDSIDTDVDSVVLTGTLLTIYENGTNVSVNLSSLNDADSDPTNELQDLSLNGNLLSLSGSSSTVDLSALMNNNTDAQAISLSGNTLAISGNSSTVDLSPYLDNTDNQTLSLFGNTLSISGGNSVTLVDNVNDADSNPTNELQTISKSGNTVTLSNGGGSFTDSDTHLTEAQVDSYVSNNGYLTSFTEVDGSVTNELQTLSRSGSNVTLSNGGGTVSINDADASSTNEIQNLSLSGTTLGISGGNTVNLSSISGDITGVTAGNALTGGGSSGNVTLHVSANNGIGVNVGADKIQLGGGLVQNTLISQGNYGMVFNLNGLGDFEVRDNNNSFFYAGDNGRIGIGTSSPSTSFDVNGSARVRNIPTITNTQATPLFADANGNLVKKNFNVVWVEGTTDVSTSSTSFTDMPDMITSIVTDANSIIEVNFQAATDNDCTDCWQEFQLVVDGQIKPAGPYNHNAKAVWEQTVNSISLYNVGAGIHTIKVQWRVGRFGSSGTLFSKVATESRFGHVRRLIVKEIR